MKKKQQDHIDKVMGADDYKIEWWWDSHASVA